MKLNPHSTRLQISKHEVIHESETTRADIYQQYVHPWYEYNEKESNKAKLIKPNPPSKEAVERARFVDKTYQWTGGGSNIRSGDERTTK